MYTDFHKAIVNLCIHNFKFASVMEFTRICVCEIAFTWVPDIRFFGC